MRVKEPLEDHAFSTLLWVIKQSILKFKGCSFAYMHDSCSQIAAVIAENSGKLKEIMINWGAGIQRKWLAANRLQK